MNLLLGKLCLSTLFFASVYFGDLSPVAGADNQIDIPHESDLVEKWLSDYPASGASIVAISMRGKRNSVSNSSHILRAMLPAGQAGKNLCFEMRADFSEQEGKVYTATGTYKVPDDWRGGLAALAFDTDYGSKVTQFSDENVQTKLTEGSCDQPVAPNSGKFFPAFWKSVVPNMDIVVEILVEAGNAQKLFMTHSQDVRTRCKTAYSNWSIYSHVCVLNNIEESMEKIDLTFLPYRRSNISGKYELTTPLKSEIFFK